MMIPDKVISAILSKDTVKKLNFDEAQVLCGNNGETTHGEVINDLTRATSREVLKHRCLGAQVTFGNAVFVAINIDGCIKVIRGIDCDKEFPFAVYESKIHI